MSVCDVAAGSSGMSSVADDSLLCPHMMQQTASPSFFEPGLFMEVWQIPLFVCCCDASLCFGRFSVPSETLLRLLTLICFIFYVNIKSRLLVFHFSVLELRTGVK